MKKQSISILVPTYCDKITVVPLIDDVISLLGSKRIDYEIIVSDDDSPDDTYKVLQKRYSKCTLIKVTKNSRNLGHGGNFKKLYKLATKESMLIMPGNGSIPPSEILKLLSYSNNYDIVIGRRDRGSLSHRRQLQTRVFNKLVTTLFKVRVTDVNSVKLIKRHVLEKINLVAQSAFLEAELCIKAKKQGYSIGEVKIMNTISPSRGNASLQIILPVIKEMFLFYKLLK